MRVRFKVADRLPAGDDDLFAGWTPQAAAEAGALQRCRDASKACCSLHRSSFGKCEREGAMKDIAGSQRIHDHDRWRRHAMQSSLFKPDVPLGTAGGADMTGVFRRDMTESFGDVSAPGVHAQARIREDGVGCQWHKLAQDVQRCDVAVQHAWYAQSTCLQQRYPGTFRPARIAVNEINTFNCRERQPLNRRVERIVMKWNHQALTIPINQHRGVRGASTGHRPNAIDVNPLRTQVATNSLSVRVISRSCPHLRCATELDKGAGGRSSHAIDHAACPSGQHLVGWCRNVRYLVNGGSAHASHGEQASWCGRSAHRQWA